MGNHRMNQVITKMKLLGLKYLVAYFDGVHTFLEPNTVLLLSKFKSMGESIYVLRSDGSSTLIVTPMWDEQRAKNKSLENQTVIGTNDLIGTFQQQITKSKVSIEKYGFLGLDSLNVTAFSRLSSFVGGELNKVDQDFLSLTACKTTEELEFAQEATKIAEKGYNKLLGIARPGLYEYELAAEIDSYMKLLGADDNFFLMSASKHNRSVRAPGDHILQKGDIILVEISPSVRGQFSQICRTVVLGDPHDTHHHLLKEKYDLLIQAFHNGITSAAPGVKMSTLVKEMNKPVESAGYGKYCHPPYMRVRGHGLGLSSILPGNMSLDNDIVLEEGMFFVVHPNQYIPETGYLLCGESVMITSKGANVLSDREVAIEFLNS